MRTSPLRARQSDVHTAQGASYSGYGNIFHFRVLQIRYLVGDTRTSMTSEQTIYVPLYQPDKLSLSVSKPTYDIYVGNEDLLTLSYLNKGRADASNVKVEIVSDTAVQTRDRSTTTPISAERLPSPGIPLFRQQNPEIPWREAPEIF